MQISFPSPQNVSQWSSALQKSSSQTSGTSSSQASGTSGDFSQIMSGPPPGGPPPGPPPDSSGSSSSNSSSGSGMSTMQFAQRTSGNSAPNDPIASLDTDDNDSVSADEFGLDSASTDVQKLFAAIDSDGSGELSKTEVTSFRDKMVAASEAGRSDASSGSTSGTERLGPPPGPPPGGRPSSSSSDSSSDSTSSTSTSKTAEDMMKQMLEMISQRYAELSSNAATSSFFTASA